MILLRALQEIPNSVAMITAGSEFYEQDAEREAYWIRAGFAEPALKAVAVNGSAPGVNSRGWDGLLWDGATVCILASGPSLTKEQVYEVGAWRNTVPIQAPRKVITINTTFQILPWADVLYACDGRWWDIYQNEVKEKSTSTVQWWTQDVAAAQKYGLHLINSERLPGLGKKPGMIHQGSASGYQAINLAWMAGAKKIILLGYDAREVNKQSHWHGDHPPGIKAGSPYAAWVKNFEALAKDLKAEGCDVINATPGSAIQAFRRMALEEALA